MSDPKPKKSRSPRLLLWGVILLFGGFAINTTLMVLGVHGYLRELTRLTTIIGLLLTVVGIFQIAFLMIRRAFSKKTQ